MSQEYKDILHKLSELTTNVASFNDRIVNVERGFNSVEESVKTVNSSIAQVSAQSKDAHDIAAKAAQYAAGNAAPGPPGFSLNSGRYSESFNSDSSSRSADTRGTFQQLTHSGNNDDRAAEVQREYEQIKDGLAKVKLPSELRVFHSASGIKGDSKQAYGILKQAAAYQETAAKWLAVHAGTIRAADQVTISSESLQELFVILLAQAATLKSEYTSLLVGSATNAETQQFFRLFERNPTAFSERELTHLERSVQLAQMQAKSSQRGGRQRGNGGSYRGGYGRGYRGGYNNRGGGYSNRGGYEQTFQSRNIPRGRGGHGQDTDQ